MSCRSLSRWTGLPDPQWRLKNGLSNPVSRYADGMAENEAGTRSGRPLTRRGRETRQRIVAAAAELMFENGVAETTLEDIRAAAGVSGSQVYHYFEDKQALVRAVIDYQADAVLDIQGAHLDRLDTMAGLRAWRDFLVDHQRRLRCPGRCPIRAPGARGA